MKTEYKVTNDNEEILVSVENGVICDIYIQYQRDFVDKTLTAFLKFKRQYDDRWKSEKLNPIDFVYPIPVLTQKDYDEISASIEASQVRSSVGGSDGEGTSDNGKPKDRGLLREHQNKNKVQVYQR